MKIRRLEIVTTSVLAAVLSAVAFADSPKQPAARGGDAAKVLSAWPPGPRLAGHEMIAKYGAPAEVTAERMIWRDAGPYKRIMLTREELPHDFPFPHKDYLEHTISYRVPVDKVDEVMAFDSSITIYRVGGELSARCDLESNNVLTLNLAKDVIDGGKSVEAARKEFGEAVMARTMGKPPAATVALQFKPQAPQAAADPEVVTIAGAPTPAGAAESAGPDAETLALLMALDNGEVHAAMVAKEKKPSKAVLGYATMMHQHHGKHVAETGQVGLKRKLAPQTTPAVDALKAKNADGLAQVVPLTGDAFTRGYLELMVKGHGEALTMIDERLALSKDDAVRVHLTATRKTVAAHLQQAKALQAETDSRRTTSR